MAVRIASVIQQLPQKVNLGNSRNFKALYSNKSASELPRNVLQNVITADKQSENGVVYDKKPFKMNLEAGKRYAWCLCGRSKTQPLCDGTHKNQQLKINLRPIHFQVEETKEYWLCNCKHTAHRPFCDGTHKSQVIQEGSSIIRQ